MKAVIPAAGIGTRLRPHTLNKPKALLPVAGKPILAHIMDDLAQAGIEAFVLIVGYEGEAVRDWFRRERPGLDIAFVEQAERLGLGHAIWTARSALGDEPFFCILGDTILKADFARLLASPQSMIAVREVADPRRFGVVEMAGDRVVRFVEKPADPPSNLAIVGAYLFRDGGHLWSSLDRLVAEDIRTRGEIQLTDALQLMVEGGETFNIDTVEDWYDCGKEETWLQTNRILLDRLAPAPAQEGVVPPCEIASDAVIASSRIGPHVTVGPQAVLENCQLSDCIVGRKAHLRNCRLTGSLVGEESRVENLAGTANIGDYCRVEGTKPRP